MQAPEKSDPPRFQISGGKAKKRVAKNGRSIHTQARPGEERKDGSGGHWRGG